MARGARDCIRAPCQPQASVCCSAWCSGWTSCCSSEQCTARCVQRAFSIKGSWLFMASSLGAHCVQGFLGLRFPPEWQNAESCVFFQSFVLKEWHRWWVAPRRWVGSSWSPAAIPGSVPGQVGAEPRCCSGPASLHPWAELFMLCSHLRPASRANVCELGSRGKWV